MNMLSIGVALQTQVIRPEFSGERTISRLNGETSLYYPRWKRLLKRCVTIPVLGGQLALLTVIICGLYGAWMKIHESSHHRAIKSALMVGLSIAWVREEQRVVEGGGWRWVVVGGGG